MLKPIKRVTHYDLLLPVVVHQLRICQLSLNFIYNHLLTNYHWSFIKDTTDLLNRIEQINNEGPFPEGTLLVSWDVVSVFPNVDNNLGLAAVKNALNARERQVPSTNCILEAVKICLKCNHSVFKDNFFLQIHGTAMGPKNACSYADLAMGEIDRKAKFCRPIKPALWWRYRHDIFDLWQQGLPALEAFTQNINSLNPTIKFELVFSESHLNVLDVTLHLVDGFIKTDVYSKPTDSHLYLPPSVPTLSMYSKQSPLGLLWDWGEIVQKMNFSLENA